MKGPNLASMATWLRICGMDDAAIRRVLATFNVAAPEFISFTHRGTDEQGTLHG
jgi:hypothetical protein